MEKPPVTLPTFVTRRSCPAPSELVFRADSSQAPAVREFGGNDGVAFLEDWIGSWGESTPCRTPE